MKTISIIGTGAAGLMSAATLVEQIDTTKDFHIHLFEKNASPGKKVIISGGGRCNVTTSIVDKKILETKYTRGWKFIKKAMGKWGPEKSYKWFENHGVPLKIQEDLRVFPCSDDGHDIVSVFENIFAKYRDNITLHYNEGVNEVASHDVGYRIITKNGTYNSDILLITTGGNAYSHTGSTGDGYEFARTLGHSITKLGPSLSSFLTKESWLHVLSGLVFEHAQIGKLSGSLLLTHFGVSGPLTFMVSSEYAWEKIDTQSQRCILCMPISGFDFSCWENFLKEAFQKNPNKRIASILAEKLPRRFVDAFIAEYFSYIEETFVGSIGRTDREKISKLLGEGIPLTLLDRRPGDEFVTAGGVDTDELDPETMESKISKNLYFAGEVLNVDGYTGGFSLEICWSSGYVAGRSIAEKL